MRNKYALGWLIVATVLLLSICGVGCRRKNSSGSRIYVADLCRNRIFSIKDFSPVQIDPYDEVLFGKDDNPDLVTFGSQGSGKNQFGSLGPSDIFVDGEHRIYVADTSNNRIVRIDDMTGKNWTSFGSQGTGIGQLFLPAAVYVDSKNRIYIADSANQRIVRIDDMDGKNWTSLGASDHDPALFETPKKIFVDNAGRIYVADAMKQRIVRFDDMNGANWTVIGNEGEGESHFKGPIGPTCVFIDETQHIYAADWNGERVVRMDMDGKNFVVYGNHFLENGAKYVLFSGVGGLFIDAASHIYIADKHGIFRMDDMNGTHRIAYQPGPDSFPASVFVQ